MIDNIEQIKKLLNFEEKNDFYHLLILKRKKDQPEGERDNHQSVRIIKTYCVENVAYLEKKYDEIKHLCEYFKARAYIHVQKQNHKDVSLDMMLKLVKRIMNNQHKQSSLFETVVNHMTVKEKRWIVDIDNTDPDYVERVVCKLRDIRPVGEKVITTIPTKNGCHLITKKFDVIGFKKIFPEIDVQRKNPTILYIPESLF